MSKIQFNLLPDIKLEYNKTQRTKKLVSSVALLVTAASVAVFILTLFTVDVVQKKQLDDSGKKVDKASKDLTSITQINQIITVQNQLSSLATLHQNKHITSRVYTYMPQLTPPNVTINKLALDLKQNNLQLSGKANSQADVNAFIDNFKFSTYKVNSSDNPKAAFTSVVESGFSISSSGVTYSLAIQVDPTLFTNTKDSNGNPVTPKLTVKGAPSPAPATNVFNQSGGQ